MSGTPTRARELPGLERRTGGLQQFFVGTEVEGGALIDHLEANPPSSPAALLAEFPAVSHEQLLGVLHGMAEAMAYVDAWKTLRLALNPGDPNDPIAQDAHNYLRERLARRAVVAAWRDEMIAAERTPEAER